MDKFEPQKYCTLKTLKQLNSDGKKPNNFDDEKIKRPTKHARIKTVNLLVCHTFQYLILHLVHHMSTTNPEFRTYQFVFQKA